MTDKKPTTKTIEVKTLVHIIAGPEKPYPVYPFSSKVFYERLKHNPFAGN